MPVSEKCPFAAEWEAISSEGRMALRELRPEDLLLYVAEGATIVELMSLLDAPRDVIEHTIMQIPYMMVWRDAQSTKVSEGMRLPKLG